MMNENRIPKVIIETVTTVEGEILNTISRFNESGTQTYALYPDGDEQFWVVDTNNNIVKYISNSEEFEEWSMAYNSDGLLVYEKDNIAGIEKTHTYNQTGDHVVWTIKNGQVYMREIYDYADNLIYKSYDDGFAMEYIYTYDENDNLVYSRDYVGYESEYEYDENSNLIHERHDDGTEAWYDYDENSNLIHERHSDGYEAWCEFDEHRNMIFKRTSDGKEYHWVFKYNDNGDMIYAKHPDGEEHVWSYIYY